MCLLFFSLAAIALPIFGVVHVTHVFHSRAIKPALGETVVALIAGLIAGLLAGVAGGVAASFACSELLAGETGEAALVLAPLTALALAVLAFALTFRWIVRYGNSPTN